MATGDFFSDADMAELRAVATDAMGGSAVIRRQQLTPDGMAGFTEAYVAVGTVACHVWDAKRTHESIVGARIISQSMWYVSVPHDTDVRETDLIDVSSVTYQVTGVPSVVTWKAELRVEAVTHNREQRA